MTTEKDYEILSEAINTITEKLGSLLLQEFLALPKDLQINMVLIKSSQLLLANVLCQIAANREELEKVSDNQGPDMKELIYNCAFTAFAEKFNLSKH